MSNNSNQSENKSGRHDETRLHREAEGAEVLDDVQEAQEEQNSEIDEENEIINNELANIDALKQQLIDAQAQVEKEKKEYLFLMAEFDNFRKRTLKEKSEIIRNAGENVLKGLLPVMDDFERGIKASESTADSEAVKEGMVLIYNKLKKYLAQNGVKEFDPADDTFDADRHEAISVVPVPDESKKGKILDTVEKGYMINDKVLRHAKVVVGQ